MKHNHDPSQNTDVIVCKDLIKWIFCCNYVQIICLPSQIIVLIKNLFFFSFMKKSEKDTG